MRCSKCKQEIKPYQLSKIVITPQNFEGHTYYYRETFHRSCAPKVEKKRKDDDDDDTSNVVYT